VVAASVKLDVVNQGQRTDAGRSSRKLLSSLAHILGNVSVTNLFGFSKCSVVVKKKYRPNSSDFEVGSMLEK
jgi:hypothetical protein